MKSVAENYEKFIWNSRNNLKIYEILENVILINNSYLLAEQSDSFPHLNDSHLTIELILQHFVLFQLQVEHLFSVFLNKSFQFFYFSKLLFKMRGGLPLLSVIFIFLFLIRFTIPSEFTKASLHSYNVRCVLKVWVLIKQNCKILILLIINLMKN